MSARRIVVLFALAVMVGTGCQNAPQGGAVPVQNDVLDMFELAKSLWDIRQLPAGVKLEHPRFAIVEFTVEYVESSGGEAPAMPKAEFGKGMELELPGALYDSFVVQLGEFDRHPVPLPAVRDAAAYGKLKGTRPDESVLFAAGSEAGAPVRYPVEGLLALDDQQKDRDAVLSELLREVGADVALQVRLRVGVYQGRAAIEKGSIFKAVGTAGTALLESRLTFASPFTVVETADKGAAVVAVDSHRFADAIGRLFRPSIGLALVGMHRLP